MVRSSLSFLSIYRRPNNGAELRGTPRHPTAKIYDCEKCDKKRPLEKRPLDFAYFAANVSSLPTSKFARNLLF